MNPVVKLIIRCALAGVLALAVSLQGNLPGISLDDLIEAGLAGVIAGITFGGIEVVTPLNPTVGVKVAAK